MIPRSRPKRSDLYTLSQSKLLENHTLHSGTYLYSPYMAVRPPPPPPGRKYTLVYFMEAIVYFIIHWVYQYIGVYNPSPIFARTRLV